jgi:REP element-mobilizing transposase RayT
MSRSKRNYRVNTYYHLYNRGNRKQKVFYSDSDYQNFLDTIFYYAEMYSIHIEAYCLMPNHFHLVVKSCNRGSDISRFMQSAMTKFCVYINVKYDLVGSTFQGTYKNTVLEDTYALLRVKKYLRNNPVEAGMVTNYIYYKWLKT